MNWMKVFLTSYPLTRENELDSSNDFVEKLKSTLPQKALNAVIISAAPKKQKKNDEYLELIREAFEKSGFEFEEFLGIDIRNKKKADEILGSADLIILSGGHIPVQHEFFEEINLMEELRSFNGVVVGISAGSMNAAKNVYAQPTLRGEANNPDYNRFFDGLGITDISIIPHYSRRKEHILDGIKLFEDIAYPDSIGRKFYALNDGSYVYDDGESRVLYGEAYLISDGNISKINDDGKSLKI